MLILHDDVALRVTKGGPGPGSVLKLMGKGTVHPSFTAGSSPYHATKILVPSRCLEEEQRESRTQ